MEVQESIQLLTEAKTLLHETGVLKEKSTYLTKESKTLEKDLRAIKKLVEDTIQEKLKAAQDKINETYDGDIASASASIKTEKANREKALEAGKKERIAKETEGLHAQIKEVNEQAKAFFKEKGLPSFCNSDFFYSIFSPKTAKDFGIFVLCFAIVFALLPFCIYNLIPVPPLDGSKILFSALPDAAYWKLMRYERYGSIALILLVWSGVLGRPLSRLIRGAYGLLFPIAEAAFHLMNG